MCYVTHNPKIVNSRSDLMTSEAYYENQLFNRMKTYLFLIERDHKLLIVPNNLLPKQINAVLIYSSEDDCHDGLRDFRIPLSGTYAFFCYALPFVAIYRPQGHILSADPYIFDTFCPTQMPLVI